MFGALAFGGQSLDKVGQASRSVSPDLPRHPA
jgi:hypothetical protein